MAGWLRSWRYWACPAATRPKANKGSGERSGKTEPLPWSSGGWMDTAMTSCARPRGVGTAARAACRGTGVTGPRGRAIACLLFALLAWLSPAAMAEPPAAPAGKAWVKVWGDEFDGDALDTTKWNPLIENDKLWVTDHDGFTIHHRGVRENIILADGKLVLKNTRRRLTATSDEVWTTSIRSQELQRRFE